MRLEKLVRPLSIAFLSQNEIYVKVTDSKVHELKLNVYHKTSESKNIILVKDLKSSDSLVKIELDETISENGGTLAAVVKGLDGNGKSISASASYALGEQEEIDFIKAEKLKN